MRPLRVAFAACVLFAAPAALLAQPAQQPAPAQPAGARPIPGIRPRPVPAPPRRNNRQRPSTVAYPIIIDSSVVNRFLGTPSPTPHSKPTRAPRRPKNGEDVFETHSTADNAK